MIIPFVMLKSFSRFLLSLLGSLVVGQTMAQSNACSFTLQLLDTQTRQPLVYTSVTYRSILPTSEIAAGKLALTDLNGQAQLIYDGYPLDITITPQDMKFNVRIDSIACDEIFTYEIPLPALQTSEVVVTALLSPKKLSVAPIEIGYVGSRMLAATDQTSIQNAVNTVPGVIMESRGYGGSHRLNIRGSALRSPFAVRNIKMYLGGIPLTSPDGQAPLDMIDAADIGSIEIVKGPVGSIYGSGNGGVVIFKPKTAYANQFRAGTLFQAGSYDLYRMNNFAEVGFANSALRVSHVWQDNQGYREQEFNRKNQLTLTYTQLFRNRDKLLLYGTYYNGNWGLPGAINNEQIADNPQQANLFSKNNNASVQRNRLMAAVSYTTIPAPWISGTTSAYFYSTHKLNPYGTSAFNSGYKDEGADGFGGRTSWGSTISRSKWRGGWQLGGEWQSEKYNILESTIDNGAPDAFRYLYDIGYIAAMAFVKTEFSYQNTFFVDGGVSYNSNRQQVRGRNDAGFAFDTTANWKSQFLPSVAFSLRLHEDIFLYHNISHGNANPTVFEMVDYENNTYNLQLRPERGINREWGFRYHSAQSPWSFSVNYYDFQLTDMIVPYSVQGPDDDMISRYRNAAAADQRGLEWSAGLLPLTIVPGVEAGLQTSGSIFRYRFDDFQSNGTILNDKMIPGIPRANVSSVLNVGLFQKVNIDIMHYWFDRMPLDNRNNIYTASYHLLNVLASIKFRTGQNFDLKVHGGINNLLGTEYSSFHALNASNGRFFNPMPETNFFAGISLVYSKN
jgi:iron complex outermembrane receptor protein